VALGGSISQHGRAPTTPSLVPYPQKFPLPPLHVPIGPPGGNPWAGVDTRPLEPDDSIVCFQDMPKFGRVCFGKASDVEALLP
jgi:hypothetical protein